MHHQRLRTWGATTLGPLQFDHPRGCVHLQHAPAPTCEHQIEPLHQGPIDGERAKLPPLVDEPVLVRGIERCVEAVVIDDPFALEAQQQRAVSILDDEVVLGQGPEKRSEGFTANPTERPVPAEHEPDLLGLRPAMLGDDGHHLQSQRREVQRACLRWLTLMVAQDQLKHGEGLEQLGADGVLWRGAHIHLALGDIHTQHRGLTFGSARASQALSQGRHRGR